MFLSEKRPVDGGQAPPTDLWVMERWLLCVCVCVYTAVVSSYQLRALAHFPLSLRLWTNLHVHTPQHTHTPLHALHVVLFARSHFFSQSRQCVQFHGASLCVLKEHEESAVTVISMHTHIRHLRSLISLSQMSDVVPTWSHSLSLSLSLSLSTHIYMYIYKQTVMWTWLHHYSLLL